MKQNSSDRWAIGNVNLIIDLMLYRTADLAPFPGEPQQDNTIIALNILFNRRRPVPKNNLYCLISPPGLTGPRLTLACQSGCLQSTVVAFPSQLWLPRPYACPAWTYPLLRTPAFFPMVIKLPCLLACSWSSFNNYQNGIKLEIHTTAKAEKYRADVLFSHYEPYLSNPALYSQTNLLIQTHGTYIHISWMRKLSFQVQNCEACPEFLQNPCRAHFALKKWHQEVWFQQLWSNVIALDFSSNKQQSGVTVHVSFDILDWEILLGRMYHKLAAI